VKIWIREMFKSRCIDAINTGTALLQYGGLNFLWMLSQLDKRLVKHIKETLVTDDMSLAKVISYCTSRGKVAVRLVVETRQVNKETLSEFIDVEEAYRRIGIFVTTREFLQLPTARGSETKKGR
jgi:translation initiation factor 2 alpha subunit (eIF-2alpha)